MLHVRKEGSRWRSLARLPAPPPVRHANRSGDGGAIAMGPFCLRGARGERPLCAAQKGILLFWSDISLDFQDLNLMKILCLHAFLLVEHDFSYSNILSRRVRSPRLDAPYEQTSETMTHARFRFGGSCSSKFTSLSDR